MEMLLKFTIVPILLVYLSVIAYGQEVVWIPNQYMTKEINGGSFILTLEFNHENKFTGRIQGLGSLSECELNFKGKSNHMNNPLYGRAERDDYHIDGKRNAGQWSFISFEKRYDKIVIQIGKYNKKYPFRIFCATYDENPFPFDIPDVLRFYPKQ